MYPGCSSEWRQALGVRRLALTEEPPETAVPRAVTYLRRVLAG
jgi:hypothetical protein